MELVHEDAGEAAANGRLVDWTTWAPSAWRTWTRSTWKVDMVPADVERRGRGRGIERPQPDV